mgnify:CR=1 FL=1
MRLALSLGRRGLGQVAPWPSVGCVIVNDGRVVGRGTSDLQSRSHAEVVALQQAGVSSKGATVYVTLEPCSHTRTTPPCADALVEAQVSRVVVGTQDPNPMVSGRGLARLRDADIEVTIGMLEAEAKDLHAGFLLTQTQCRPFVTLKLASTLDGRIATASGDSKWITGRDARRLVHTMRMNYDAVLIGGGTARADDPELTIRDLGAKHQPVRIVASRRLNLPWPCRLAETISLGPVWLMHGQGEADPRQSSRWTEAGADLFPTEVKSGQIDVTHLLKTLSEKGLTRVLCEGGGSLAASLIQADLVDQLIVMSAGVVVGAEGQPSVGALGISTLSEAHRFELSDFRVVGGDIMQTWSRLAPEA